MKWVCGVLTICCMMLWGCRPDDAMGPASTARVLPSDEDVMVMAYDIAYNVPETFFVDERAATSGSYTVYHVKDESASYELCTDDYAEALAWESADNDNRAVNGVYVDSYENERYFEFVRELAYPDGIGNIPDPTSPGFSRVFKCSYVDRKGVDRNLRNGYAGTLNRRPMSNEVMRDFTEYMWQFTFFWPAQKKVLDVFSEERAETHEHTLLLAFVTNRGSDKCDLIEVVDWVFIVDKSDGHLTKEFRPLYEFGAELANGSPRKCED